MKNIQSSNRTLFPFGPLWSDALYAGQAGPRTDAKLRPALDAEETDEALLICVELPGLAKSEVDVSIEDGVLTISGEKSAKSETEDSSFHIIERRYGRFARSLKLPTHVNVAAAEATFENGVLTVSLPKEEQAKPKRVTIN